MKRKTDYSKIKLENTGLITNNRNLDVVYNILKENNINNLEELFLKDEEDSINYGMKSYNFSISQTKGTIKLLRYKYLGEGLTHLNILDGEIICRGSVLIKRSGDEKPLPITAANYLCILGISYNFATEMQKYMNHQEKLIDVFKRILENKNIKPCDGLEYDRNIEKIALIVEWYNLKHNIANELISLEDVRKELKKLYGMLEDCKMRKKAIDLEISQINEKINRVQETELQILRRKM